MKPHQSHTLHSGQNLKDLDNKTNFQDPLGKLTIKFTDDGSPTLESDSYNECFHNRSSALNETKEKFTTPSELYRYKEGKTIYVLDICIGMGYNTACLIEEIIKNGQQLDWYGLEIDKRPLVHALTIGLYKSYWSKNVCNILKSISQNNRWSTDIGKGEIFWGDARKMIDNIPKTKKFDVIMLDPFSPQKCPQLWSKEFLQKVVQLLSKSGRVITYSSSAALRKSLRETGLEIISRAPLKSERSKWSSGTVALHTNENNINEINKEFLKQLSQMEEEHLLTKASIPYRDPTGSLTAKEIKKQRKIEQSESVLESTTRWKARWGIR